VSHQPERKEKNCLNCGTIVAGRYCQECGQENIVPKQSFWSLFTHFVYDIFHFDGKFFHTLKYLLFRPGTVPKEYVAGKRMSYLDPIRMYLFTSAVFFLLFFTFLSDSNSIVNLSGERRSMTKVERLEYSSFLHQHIKNGRADSNSQRQLDFLLDTTLRIRLMSPEGKRVMNDSSFFIQFKDTSYLMEVHKPLPLEDNINIGKGWFDKTVEQKWKVYKRRFADDDRAMISDLINTFLHKFPYILFVSLPFFALILKLLYVRRRQFIYSDHAVFTLYHYIFTFILLLFYFLFLELSQLLSVGIFETFATILFLSGGVYLFIAMKRFYGQQWLKTLGKFLLLNILALFVILILMLGFILLSIFQL
jgi:hypothetical protein